MMVFLKVSFDAVDAVFEPALIAPFVATLTPFPRGINPKASMIADKCAAAARSAAPSSPLSITFIIFSGDASPYLYSAISFTVSR